MKLVEERVNSEPAHEYQSVLGMSFMHGARRRLDQKLAEVCGDFPYRATTIDAFALSIINRWRMSIGVSKLFSPKTKDGDPVEGLFEVHASFEWIRREASQLLSKPTVGRCVGVSFPLVVVDEFQDCQGHQLEIVKALANHTQLLLAADDFQLLNPVGSTCSAVEWILGLEQDGRAVVEDLTTPRRTNNQALLVAARCLRDNRSSSVTTVPVICCPSSPLAASWIIRNIAMPPFRWKGACAIISPTLDSFVRKTLESCNSQLVKKNLTAIHFHAETSQENEIKALSEAVGISTSASKDWAPQDAAASPLGQHVIDRVRHYCRLRGIKSISEELVASFAERMVSTQRAFGHRRANRIVSTIHGAKNREFENVFVLWNLHTVGRWSEEEQRRLLYNAITRARSNCLVLVLGSEKEAQSSPALRLLGPPRPAFSKPKKRS
jgi:superfamily I DNA/RNA helicase